MLFALALLIPAACSVNKPLAPRQRMLLRETVGEDDQQLTLTLTNLSKDPHLRYRINTPGRTAPSASEAYEDEDEPAREESRSEDAPSDPNAFSAFGHRLRGSITKNYTAPGEYGIMLFNTGNREIEVQVGSYVYKKINDTNKDVTELRNLLGNLHTMVESLGNENYYLGERTKKNIEEARFIGRVMNWLILFPLLTILVGYSKYVIAKQMVKPKGKRFKGLL